MSLFFTVEIELGSDVMQNRYDIAEALVNVSTTLEEAQGSDPANGPVMDRNGNKVGFYRMFEA